MFPVDKVEPFEPSSRFCQKQNLFRVQVREF